MRFRRGSIAAALLSSLLAGSAHAAGDEAEELGLLFDTQEKVVSATRSEGTVRNAPAVVSVMTFEQARRSGARTLVDVLRLMPGIEVSIDSLGLPRVAVRGRRSAPQLLVLVDGLRLNDVYDGAALVDFPIGMIERVEMIRGPGSALYGTNAFAGVVNVITRDGAAGAPNSSRRGRAALWGGSYATAGGEVTAGVGPVRLYASADRTDGPAFEVERDALTQSGQGVAGTPEGVTHGGARGANVGLFVRGPAALSLEANAFLRRSAPYVGPFDTLTPDGEIARDWFTGRATWRRSFDPGAVRRLDASVSVYAIESRVSRDLEVYPDGYTTGDRDGDGDAEVFVEGVRRRERFSGRTAGMETQVEWKTGDDTLTAGAQVEWLALPSYELATNELNGAYRGPALANHAGVSFDQEGRDRVVAGIYLQDSRQLSPGASITLGLRHDQYSDFGGATSPRAGLVFTPLGALTWKLLFGTAFRAPTFRELYDRTEESQQGAFVGNRSLGPETIRTLETAVEGRLSIAGRPLTMRADAFYDEIRGSIVQVQTTGTTNTLRNAGDVNTVGGEVEGRFALDERTWAFANASWFRARDLGSRTWLTDVPQWRANAGVYVSPIDALTLHAVWRSGAERRNNARTTLERLHAFRIPRYDVVDVVASTEPLFDHVVLSASVLNALDREIVDDAPRPDRMPGNLPASERTFFLRLEVRL